MIARQKLKPAVRAALAAAGKLEAFLAREQSLMVAGRPKSTIKRMLAQEFEEFREIVAAVGDPEQAPGLKPEQPQENTPPPDISSEDETFEQDVSEVRRTTDFRKAVAWVFDMMATQDVRPEDAPSSGAYAMLKHCQSSPRLADKLYETILPKLMPAKGTLADEEDDIGISDLQTLCDRVAEAARKAKESTAQPL